MLVYCDKSCRQMKDASLNVDTNEVICNYCEESIENVTKFIKLSMKANGDVLESKNRKAFVFKCENHNVMTEVFFDNSRLKGKECSGKDGDCLINITEAMKVAVKEFGRKNEGAGKISSDMQSQSE